MNSNIILLIVSGLFCFMNSGCQECCIKGQGSIVTRALYVDSFNKILVDDPFSYNSIRSNEFSITAEAHANLIDSIDISESGGEVRIGFKNGCYCKENRIIINISSPKLEKLILRDNYSGMSDSPTDFITDSLGNIYHVEGDKKTKIYSPK